MLKQGKQNTAQKKMRVVRVYDRVHGEVSLSEVVAYVVSLPEVQRLNHVRQLGLCYLIYPSATHTRLEHSVGVSHLSRTIALKLQKQLPCITDDEVTCVALAGLLHDVGHGPFSHLFESYMMKSGIEWSHEQMACHIVDRLFCDHAECFRRSFLTDQKWRDLIKLMILGYSSELELPTSMLHLEGKRCLLGIVHSADNGMDADKMDYLIRDALSIYGTYTESVNLKRIISSMRPSSDGNKVIFDARASHNLQQMLHLRCRMHVNVYQHSKVLWCDQAWMRMMCDMDVSTTPFHRNVVSLDKFIQISDANVLCQRPAIFTTLQAEMATVTRVPIAVDIDLSPRCVKCNAPTRPSDMFCSTCGNTTRGRLFKVRNGRSVSYNCVMSEEEANLSFAEVVRSKLGADRSDVLKNLTLCLADISIGARTQCCDPYDPQTVWETQSPLSGVTVRSNQSEVQSLEANSSGMRVAYFFASVHDGLEGCVQSWAEQFGSWRHI